MLSETVKGTGNVESRHEVSAALVHTQRYLSGQRKVFYYTWDCRNCGASYFFSAFKCPLCEAAGMDAVKHKCSYLNSANQRTSESGKVNKGGVKKWKKQQAL